MHRGGPRRRVVILALLAAASTCRPPDLTASGGCIPWSESSTGRGTHVAAVSDGGPDAGPHATTDAADAAADAGPALAAALPPLRVRFSLRPGAPIEQADPVGQQDVFFSQLAAALAARPLFEADPDVETLADDLARAAARRHEDPALSDTRSTGLEPFLVAAVGLQRPAAGTAVTEPTYVVGLTLVVRRTAERDALAAPPAVRWELDLPARAVRSARLVGTVAQAIEARAQVELDREATDGRTALADPLLAQHAADADAQLFALGRVAYADLAATLAGDVPAARAAAARALGRAGDPDLLDVYGRMLGDADPAVRLAAVDGFWRALEAHPPAVGADAAGGVPSPAQAWTVPAGDSVCRTDTERARTASAGGAAGALLGEHLAALRRAVADPDAAVAHAALVLLTEAGDTEERAAIRTALRGADEPSTQDLLAVALGRLGDRSVVPRLRQIVAGDRELKPAAAVTLGRLGDRGADDTLRGMLGEDDAVVRCAAAEALAGSVAPETIAALVPLLSGAQPAMAAQAAKAALVAAGEDAIPALAAALDGSDASVAWSAAETLGEIGSPKAVAPLTARLAGLDSVLRDYIVDALGRIGDVHALPALVAAFGGTPAYRNDAPILRAILLFGRRAVGPLVDGLASPDAGIRAGALEALDRLGDDEHVSAVLPLLADADPAVRARAAAYFAGAHDDRAVTALSTMLDDDDADAAAAAAGALGAIGGDAARAALERTLGDARPAVAVAAANALARLRNPDSVREILDAASRLSAYDRGRMIEALVAFGENARAPLLASVGADRLRYTALAALDGLGAPVPVGVLSPHRLDARPSVRELVARMLGRTNDPAALEPLRVLLGDPSAAVREAAVGAVAALGVPDAGGVLRAALADEKDEWVARAIRRALLQLGSVP